MKMWFVFIRFTQLSIASNQKLQRILFVFDDKQDKTLTFQIRLYRKTDLNILYFQFPEAEKLYMKIRFYLPMSASIFLIALTAALNAAWLVGY